MWQFDKSFQANQSQICPPGWPFRTKDSESLEYDRGWKGIKFNAPRGRARVIEWKWQNEEITGARNQFVIHVTSKFNPWEEQDGFPWWNGWIGKEFCTVGRGYIVLQLFLLIFFRILKWTDLNNIDINSVLTAMYLPYKTNFLHFTHQKNISTYLSVKSNVHINVTSLGTIWSP